MLLSGWSLCTRPFQSTWESPLVTIHASLPLLGAHHRGRVVVSRAPGVVLLGEVVVRGRGRLQLVPPVRPIRLVRTNVDELVVRRVAARRWPAIQAARQRFFAHSLYERIWTEIDRCRGMHGGAEGRFSEEVLLAFRGQLGKSSGKQTRS